MESPVSASRMAPRSKSATSFREAQEHDASATSSSTTPRRDPAGTSWQETEPQSTAPAPKHPHMLSSIDRGSFKTARVPCPPSYSSTDAPTCSSTPPLISMRAVFGGRGRSKLA